MDSRERVFLALDFHEPDRVPVDFWGSSGFYRALRKTSGMDKEAFLNQHDVDFRYIEGPRYVGPPLECHGSGTEVDIWGVPRRAVAVPTPYGEETYKEVAASPLGDAASADEVDAYAHWPSPDWFDYTIVQAQCEAIRKKGRIVVFMGDRLNRIAQLKPAMYLRGTKQILLDMGLNPEMAGAIFSNIRRFYCAYAERIFASAKGKLDILLMGDEWHLY